MTHPLFGSALQIVSVTIWNTRLEPAGQLPEVLAEGHGYSSFVFIWFLLILGKWHP